MAKSNPRDSIKLTSVDDLFSTEKSRVDSQRAYFGRIRTLIPATSGQRFGIIRTA